MLHNEPLADLAQPCVLLVEFGYVLRPTLPAFA